MALGSRMPSESWHCTPRLSAALAVCLVAGCGGCGSPRVPADAGTVDAGRDSGPRDAGHDSGPGDAGDRGPNDPEWVVPTGLPADCMFDVALHPERIPHFEWRPCFDGRAGCEELGVDWGDWAVIDTLRVYSDAFAGLGEPLVTFFRPIVDGRTELLAIRPEDGAVVWAFRFFLGVEHCRPSPATIRREEIVFETERSSDLLDDIDPIARMLASAPGEPSVIDARDSIFIGAGAQRIRVGATGVIALEIMPAYRVGTIRDGVFRVTASPGAASHPVVVGDTLLFDQSVAGRRVVNMEGADGTVAPYLDIADADVTSLRTDGEWIAWIEGRMPVSTGWWAQTSLRVARFTTDPSALAPRTALELGEYGIPSLRVGGGWVVVDRTDAGRYVKVAVPVEMGSEHVLVPPGGHLFAEDPLYVTPHEVALGVYAESGVARTIWRVALP